MTPPNEFTGIVLEYGKTDARGTSHVKVWIPAGKPDLSVSILEVLSQFIRDRLISIHPSEANNVETVAGPEDMLIGMEVSAPRGSVVRMSVSGDTFDWDPIHIPTSVRDERQD